MALWARLAHLPVAIEAARLEPLRLASAGNRRHTTVVCLAGRGQEGLGEDVTWEKVDQLALQRHGLPVDVRGTWTLDEFSRALDDFALFPSPTGSPSSRLYRRWALESAALDLALRQAGRSLAAALGLEPRPLGFVVSCGLGSPPSLAPVERRLARHPGLRFKLDWSPEWSAALVAELAATGVVLAVDLKGHYRDGSFRGPRPDAAGYRAVAEGLPGAWIEDAWLDDETGPALEPFRERLTWDAPLLSLADLIALPFKPAAINVKPSRFGRLAELFAVYEYCAAHGIAMYGGGQFELGPGRGQLQLLASLFHPDAANDVAPAAYHDAEAPSGLPASPLAPRPTPTGFAWA